MENSLEKQSEIHSASENEISLKERCKSIVLGLFIGDALGATSEFQIPWEVPQMCINVYDGWPSKLVGGGKARWNRGEPTDDSSMAIAIVRAIVENKGKFSGDIVLKHFMKWKSSGPRDIGSTTALALERSKSLGIYASGKWYYDNNRNSAANGSLMRNGVIAALFPGKDQEMEALDATVLHGIITHYAPLSVVCCVVHTLLIREALVNPQASKPPTLVDITNLLKNRWNSYLEKTTNTHVKEWIADVGMQKIDIAEKQLLKELNGFENYDPYNQDYRGRSGFSILTLLISLWALHWSFQTSHPKLAHWLPEWPYKQHGFATIMWVVLIGADADTYGATAGPLLAAYHPNIEANFKEGLVLLPETDRIFQ